jgi:hypothetical protein
LPGPKETGKIPAPYDLRIEFSSRRATVHWSINRGKADPIYGYNIYLSETPLKDQFRRWHKDHPDPYNHTPYPGDTDGDRSRESFEITHLENGKIYYVSVRTVGENGLESASTDEVEFQPLSNGTFVISSNHSASNGGFEFDSGLSTPARDRRCDIYLYAKGEEVGISSPGRLGAGLRNTYFRKPGIINVREMDTIKIKPGDEIIADCRLGRAEMTIKKIARVGSEVEATIRYVFYPEGFAPD